MQGDKNNFIMDEKSQKSFKKQEKERKKESKGGQMSQEKILQRF